MPRIFYHIGLHKTATTTLQEAFFPACPDLNLLTTANRDFKAFYRLTAYSDPAYFDAERARALVEPLLRPDMPNLLSNEAFSGPLYAGIAEYGLDHRTPILDNIRSAHPDAGVIITLRRQDDWARSIYRQYLKSGGTKSPERFFGFSRSPHQPLFARDRFNFLPLVDRLHALFPGKVLVLAYEDFRNAPDAFLSALAAYLGIGVPDVRLQRMNATRLGPWGLRLSRLLNHFFRSHLNPAGLLPGAPRFTPNGLEFRSPSIWLHDNWPWRGSGDPDDALHRLARTILAEQAGNNETLDTRYALGLAQHRYY